MVVVIDSSWKVRYYTKVLMFELQEIQKKPEKKDVAKLDRMDLFIEKHYPVYPVGHLDELGREEKQIRSDFFALKKDILEKLSD